MKVNFKACLHLIAVGFFCLSFSFAHAQERPYEAGDLRTAPEPYVGKTEIAPTPLPIPTTCNPECSGPLFNGPCPLDKPFTESISDGRYCCCPPPPDCNRIPGQLYCSRKGEACRFSGGDNMIHNGRCTNFLNDFTRDYECICFPDSI